MSNNYTEDFEVLSSQGSDDESTISDGDINFSDGEANSSLTSQSAEHNLDSTDFDNGSSLVEINNKGIPNAMSLSASLALNSLMPLDHDLHDGVAKDGVEAPPTSADADNFTSNCTANSVLSPDSESTHDAEDSLNAESAHTESKSNPMAPGMLLLATDACRASRDAEIHGAHYETAYDTVTTYFCNHSLVPDSLADYIRNNEVTGAQLNRWFSLKNIETKPRTTPTLSASRLLEFGVSSDSAHSIVFSGCCTEETRDYVAQLYESVPDIVLSWHDLDQNATLVLPSICNTNELLYQNSNHTFTTRIRFWDARELGSTPAEVSARTKAFADTYDFMVVLGPFNLPNNCLHLPAKQAALKISDSWSPRRLFTINNREEALEYRTLLQKVSIEEPMPLQSEYSSLETPEQRVASAFKRAFEISTKAVSYFLLLVLTLYAGCQFADYLISRLPLDLQPDNIIISNFTDEIPTVVLPKDLQVVSMDQDVGRVLVPLGVDIRLVLAEMVMHFRSQLKLAQALLMKLVNYVGEALPKPKLHNVVTEMSKTTIESLPTIISPDQRAETVIPVLTHTNA